MFSKGWRMPGVEKLGLLGKLNTTMEILSLPTTTTIEEVVRPEGYAIEGLACFRVAVRSPELSADGWGTGSTSIAQAKALSEALERFVMFTQAKNDPMIKTSNGWAAHTDLESAMLRAVSEVVERDTALSTWFKLGPYYLVSETQWPDVLIHWRNSISGRAAEFSNPLVLMSEGQFGACVSVLLKSSDGRIVVGHASGIELKKSIESAFYEALRSAHASLRFEDYAETVELHGDEVPTVAFGPGANGMAYAYGAPMPELTIELKSDLEIQTKWHLHCETLRDLVRDSELRVFKVGDRFVVRALVRGAQEIFWGRTPKHMKVKNNFPHFVG